MSSVERYRQVVAELAGAVVELRRRDAERAAELRRRLEVTERELHSAADRVTLAHGMAELRWEAALAVMWSAEEPGKPRPRPDPHADPDSHEELERAADAALEDLRAAAGRRLFRLRPGR